MAIHAPASRRSASAPRAHDAVSAKHAKPRRYTVANFGPCGQVPALRIVVRISTPTNSASAEWTPVHRKRPAIARAATAAIAARPRSRSPVSVISCTFTRGAVSALPAIKTRGAARAMRDHEATATPGWRAVTTVMRSLPGRRSRRTRPRSTALASRGWYVPRPECVNVLHFFAERAAQVWRAPPPCDSVGSGIAMDARSLAADRLHAG